MAKHYTVKIKGTIWYLNRQGKGIFYFSLNPTKNTLSSLPAGYKVKEGKTGMPVIKRKN